MRAQLACGTLAVACVTVPRSEARLASRMSVGLFPGSVRCRVRSKGRRVACGPVAAVRADEAGLGGNVSGVREGLVTSVGTPADSLGSFRDWYMADKQLVVVSFSAFVTAGFMSLLLAAAIPSLIAIRKAAEALEKLADTAREELPGTMAAIRLSGMEISDLTMELNDLGQEISNGVKNSARALNAAESGMRQVGGLAANVWQKQAVVQAQAMQPLVARTAKQVTETLVQTRTLVVNFQIMSHVSSWLGALQVRTLAIPFQKKGQNT